MGVRRGDKCPFPPWKLGLRAKNFSKSPKSASNIPINWSDSCNDSFLLVWNSHCTRVRFTVIVSCSDGLAVHSCPFLCLQRRVAKVASELSCWWSLLRNNTVATNLQMFTLNYGSRRFAAWDCWTHTSWQAGPEPAWDIRRGEEFSERGPNFLNYVKYF